MAEIDHPVMNERTAIIDSDDGRTPVPEVRDTDLGAEWKGAMGRGHRSGLEHFTIGGSVAVEPRAIPTGFTGDHPHNIGRRGQLWRRGG